CVLGPSWSPDGRRIACGAGRTSGRSTETVVEVPVEGGPEKQVTSEIWENVFRVIWLEDGSGLIMAAKKEFFSAEGAQIWFLQYPSGAVRRITNDLSFYGTRSLGLTADSSTIATIQVTESFRVFVTAPNEEEGNAKEIIPRSPKIIFTFSWTPDGKIIYTTKTGENCSISIMNADGSGSKQLISDIYIKYNAIVSPDGRYILFTSNRSGNWNIWRMDIDGGNQKQLTSNIDGDDNPVCSPDGKWVVFVSSKSGKATLWKIG